MLCMVYIKNRFLVFGYLVLVMVLGKFVFDDLEVCVRIGNLGVNGVI